MRQYSHISDWPALGTLRLITRWFVFFNYEFGGIVC